MIVVTILAYFLLIALLAMMVVFPGGRVRVAAAVGQAFGLLLSPFLYLRRTLPAAERRLLERLLSHLRFFRTWLAQHRWLAVAAVAAVVAPSLLVIAVRGPAVFDFAENGDRANIQIRQLLAGEQLVPPPPPPPEVFVTREVELVRPDIGLASRDWGLLDQQFTQRLLAVFRVMKERHGYEMVLLEGYRSPQRQAELLAQGRHVTQVGANMSYHQHGLAADAAFLRDGRIALSERDPWVMRGYELYGEVAEQVGLTWGGKWTMRDLGHVELRRPGVLGRQRTPMPAAG